MISKGVSISTVPECDRFHPGSSEHDTQPKIGQWFWVRQGLHEESDIEWLGCVVNIGSNYIELHEPNTPHDGYKYCRVNIDDIHDFLRPDPAAEVGGMEFSDISQFDQWLAEPENLNRVLPYPRSLVAMRVRRNEKERE